MALTVRRQRFVDAYLVDPNATQAAIAAGYSKKGASSEGERLLRNVEVAAAIAEGQRKRAERVELTQDYVLTRIRDNVERAMQAEAVTDHEGNETGLYTYQGSVANRGLELLGKHLGMFGDKIDHRFPDMPKEARLDRLGLILNTARQRAATNGNGKH